MKYIYKGRFFGFLTFSLILLCLGMVSCEQNDSENPVTDLSAIKSDYTATSGETLCGTLSSNIKISVADGATVTLKGVTIGGETGENWKWAGLTCLGDATLILEDTNSVTAFYEGYSGIYVSENKTLTIKGTGSLTATGQEFGAGIGNGDYTSCGNIVISGGSITAVGGYGASGIGCGDACEDEAYENPTCGDITIEGGSVVAYGGYGASGIGAGFATMCGNIRINGGSITAVGGNGGSGIGGGTQTNLTKSTITISGGSVTAVGGEYASGLGSGWIGNWGDILIEDGIISASAGLDSVGIGCGYAPSSCGDITISGGYVMARGNNEGAAIGGGRQSLNGCGDITISGGTVIAEGGSQGGSGIGTSDYSCCKNIKISGGSVTASGGHNAAGIGTGPNGSFESILISGGEVRASGGMSAAGIGTGAETSCEGTITITSGVTSLFAEKGSGGDEVQCIGSGKDGTCGAVTIGGVEGAITESPYTYSPGADG